MIRSVFYIIQQVSDIPKMSVLDNVYDLCQDLGTKGQETGKNHHFWFCLIITDVNIFYPKWFLWKKIAKRLSKMLIGEKFFLCKENYEKKYSKKNFVKKILLNEFRQKNFCWR